MKSRRPTCSHCGAILVLKQPHEADYIRLLAVCPDLECGRWYLRTEVPGGRSTLAELPVPTLAQLRVRPDGVPTEADARAALSPLAVVS